MSSDSIRGNLYVGDIGALEPFEGQDRLLELFRQFLVWHGQREPVVPGDPFTKFATKGFLVDMGVLTENQVIGDDDHDDPDVTEIDEPRVYAYARDFEPDSTTPCAALSTISMGAGKPDARVLAFDSATNEAAQVQLIMPPEWPGNAVQVRLYWSHSLATSWDVVWQVQAHTAADGETFDALFGPGFEATDTGGDPSTIYISASGVLTITTAASSAQAGDLVFIKVTRRADLAGDTLNGDAYLHAIEFRIGGVPADFPEPITLSWNPADKHADIVLSNSDLTAAHSVAAFRMVRANVSKSTGKWYFEVTFDTLVNFGTVGLANATQSLADFVGGSANSWSTGSSGPSQTYYNGSSTSVAPYAIASGDRVDVAWDADAGKVWFRCDGNWIGASGVDTGFGVGIGDPATGSNPRYTSVTGTLFPACAPGNGGQITINSTIVGTIPSGFSAWE